LPPEIIHRAIWLYLRFTLSFGDVEDLLAQRPTPSHVRSITPRATHRGDEYVARGRRGRLKIRMAQSPSLPRIATWRRPADGVPV